MNDALWTKLSLKSSGFIISCRFFNCHDHVQQTHLLFSQILQSTKHWKQSINPHLLFTPSCRISSAKSMVSLHFNNIQFHRFQIIGNSSAANNDVCMLRSSQKQQQKRFRNSYIMSGIGWFSEARHCRRSSAHIQWISECGMRAYTITTGPHVKI